MWVLLLRTPGREKALVFIQCWLMGEALYVQHNPLARPQEDASGSLEVVRVPLATCLTLTLLLLLLFKVAACGEAALHSYLFPITL